MTDSVARAEAEKALEQAVGYRHLNDGGFVYAENGDVVYKASEYRELAESVWSHTLSVMEENERLKRERDKWQTLFYESEEYNCSCNIVDITKPVGDPLNYVCDWHEDHPHIALAREEVLTLAERLASAEAKLAIFLDQQVRFWRPPLPLPPTEGKASQEQNGEREK